MKKRQNLSSGTPWEAIAGYSRLVKVGHQIMVAGTTATGADGTIVGQGDAAAQSHQIIKNIRRALLQVGSDLDDVVRTRIYVVNASDAEAVMRVHGDYFGEIRPAATLVIVQGLVHSDMLVEIEVEAIHGAQRED